jgi:phosphomannomutase
VDWADGFGLIRASNTTPVLVLRFKARRRGAAAHRGDMLALLRRQARRPGGRAAH